MLTWLSKRSELKRKARALYGAVVAQARNPAFYTAYGVADEPIGRYELIALHLILTLGRLGQPDVGDEELRRATLETFITDLDDAMREFGVGDPSVPKRVKRAAGGAHARNEVYGPALAQTGNDALESTIAEYVYDDPASPHAAPLAAYVRRAVAHLASLPAQDLRAGFISFPSPEQQP
jgi:cytochrome b pre-mRNA-processing protein 3